MLTGCSGGEWRRPNNSRLHILTVHNNNHISLVLPKRKKTGKLNPSDNFGGSCKKTLIFCSFQRTFGNTSRVSKEVLYLVLVLLYHVAIIWKKCNIEAVLKEWSTRGNSKYWQLWLTPKKFQYPFHLLYPSLNRCYYNYTSWWYFLPKNVNLHLTRALN